jgi:choline dehydrogenase
MRSPSPDSWLLYLSFASLFLYVYGAPHAGHGKRGLLDSFVGPLVPAVQAILDGDGLVEGALGALKGALGLKQEFDYVVVGGGTAGNAMGYRLAEAGFSVAIIEAGFFYEIAEPVIGTTPLGAIVQIGSSPLDQIPTATVWHNLPSLLC